MSAEQLAQLKAHKELLFRSQKINSTNSKYNNYLAAQRNAAALAESSILLNSTPTYKDLLASTNEDNRDPAQESGVALANLQKLTPLLETARSVLKRLQPNEISLMNDYFPDIVQQLRAKFPRGGIKTDSLVSFIKVYLEKYNSYGGRTLDETQLTSGLITPSTVDPQLDLEEDLQDDYETPMKGSLRYRHTKTPAEEAEDEPIATRLTPFDKGESKSRMLHDIDVAYRSNAEVEKMIDKFCQTHWNRGYTKTRFGKDVVGLEGRSIVMALHETLQQNGFISDEPSTRYGTRQTGRGLKKGRNIIHGKGMSDPEIGNKKFYVDLKKLNHGILSVKYRSTQQYRFPPFAVSSATKAVVMDLITDKYEPRIYDVLKPNEKKHIQFFAKIMHLDENNKIESKDVDDLFEQFQIYKGLLLAGNSNTEEIIPELKRLTIELMGIGRIGKSEGNTLLYQLSTY